MDAQLPDVPPPPKPPKNPPKAPPKGPSTARASASQDTSARTPCTFYSSPNGCKKGLECTYLHDWGAFPNSEKSTRCRSCGSKSHKSPDCKAGTRQDDAKSKPKASKAAGFPKNSSESVQAPPPPSAEANQQQIKSMLADAALILQQVMPNHGQGNETPSAPNQAVPIASAAAPQATPVQGTPVTLASIQAQLENLRAAGA